MSSPSTYVSCNDSTEDILAVPRIWTKKAYNWLLEQRLVPRTWHLEGRWGSRTHKVDDERMGFPIVSADDLLKLVESEAAPAELKELLLNVPGVEVLRHQPFVESKRARENPIFDATIHPERERARPMKRARIEGMEMASKATLFPPPAKETKEAAFTYVELFCGIGGFGVALEALGGQCLMVSEIDETCRELYMENFPNTPRNRIFGDIHQVKESDFPERGTMDLLVGGFPCQPFSNLSEQPGFKCEKGRGLLFQQIVRVLEYSQPKAFLLENVPGLRDMKDSFEHILASFASTGYRVESEVCNARGITATTRKRLFFVGLRNDLHADGSTFQFPYVPDLQLKAETILDYDELPPQELAILRLNDETMDQLIAGRRWRPHSLAWPNRPLDTMTSHYGNAVGRGDSQLVPCHAPHNPRRFSPRECARLMGFPNTYRMTPQKENQGDMAYRKQFYRMFGNAVCPPMIAALAGAVLDHCHLSGNLDWTEKGLTVAVALSMGATRSKPVPQPSGCLVPKDDQDGDSGEKR